MTTAGGGPTWRPRRGDDTSAPVDFSELRPGLPIAPWTVPIRARTARRLCEGVGATFDEDEPVTPALAGNLGVGFSFRVLPRNILHTAQVIRVLGPVQVGDSVQVRGSVRDVTRRANRAYVSVAADIEVGGAAAWSIVSESFVPGMQAEGLPRARQGVPDVPDGTGLGADEWAPSIDEMVAFSGPGNFHSDPEVARKFGYPRPVAQGMQLAARAMRAFPSLAAAGREVRIWFTGVTMQDDLVSFGLRGDDSGTLWVTATGPDGRRRLTMSSEFPNGTGAERSPGSSRPSPGRDVRPIEEEHG